MLGVLDANSSVFATPDSPGQSEILAALAADDFDKVWSYIYESHRNRRSPAQPGDIFQRAECSVLFLSGALDSARRICLEVLTTAGGEQMFPAAATFAHTVLSRVATEQLVFLEARHHMSEALGRRPASSSRIADGLRVVRARLSAASGDPASALGWLNPVLEHPERWSAMISVDPSIVPWAVRTAIEGGNRTMTSDLVTLAEEELATTGTNGASMAACALHARGLLMGDPVMVVQAASMLRDSPRRLAEAEANEDAGDILAAGGAHAGALEHYERAARIFQVLSARLGAHRIRSRLRHCEVDGRRTRRARPSIGWDGLSSKELSVAALVADGLTNKQVAEVLFMSPYTVDSHLRHIFAKLGVSSRVALTRVVAAHQSREGPPQLATPGLGRH